MCKVFYKSDNAQTHGPLGWRLVMVSSFPDWLKMAAFSLPHGLNPAPCSGGYLNMIAMGCGRQYINSNQQIHKQLRE